jgi:hypothetical protein
MPRSDAEAPWSLPVDTYAPVAASRLASGAYGVGVSAVSRLGRYVGPPKSLKMLARR